MPRSVAATARHRRTARAPVGYDAVWLKVDALSSSANNARQIRDALMAMPAEPAPPRLVLLGYSKGTPDILEAVVAYPEIRDRIAAVVSIAGAVGGSPLANDAEQYQAELFRHFPGATCRPARGRRGESEAGQAQRVARPEPAAERAALYSLVDVAPAAAHLVDSQGELQQAGARRCAQRQPDDLL